LELIYGPEGPWREVIMAFLIPGRAGHLILSDEGAVEAHKKSLERRGVAVWAAWTRAGLSSWRLRCFYRRHSGQLLPEAVLKRIDGSLRRAREQG
jgi:hypothetical protein